MLGDLEYHGFAFGGLVCGVEVVGVLLSFECWLGSGFAVWPYSGGVIAVILWAGVVLQAGSVVCGGRVFFSRWLFGAIDAGE